MANQKAPTSPTLMNPILIFCLAAGLLFGCSSTRVITDFAEGTDFSAFRTFEYRDSPNNLAVSSPLIHQRIVNAIRSEMLNSGLREVTKDPDVFVTYHGSTQQQIQFQTTYSGMNSWSGSRRSGSRVGLGMTTSTTRPTTVTQGTLVIDVWDASRNAMLWRSVASSVLSSSPSRNTSAVNDAIQRAFRQFPPK